MNDTVLLHALMDMVRVFFDHADPQKRIMAGLALCQVLTNPDLNEERAHAIANFVGVSASQVWHLHSTLEETAKVESITDDEFAAIVEDNRNA